MVWGPNLGINYPFRGGGRPYPTMETDPINFMALDTNGDGIINYLDDPYGPYYPGDDFVDWIGMSLYWYPDEGTGFNGPVPATYFRDQLMGVGPTVEQFSPLALQDGGLRQFYRRFVQEKNKPMMIPETAAPYIPSQPAVASHAAIKEAWYSQILSAETRRELSRILLVNQFEEIKADAGMEIRDWRCAADPAVISAFKKVLNQHRTELVFGTDFSIGCGGQFKPK